MRTLEIKGITGTSKILVGEKLENLEAYIPAEKFVIITDENISRIYRKDFPACKIIEISTGEKVKNLDTVKYIYEQLMELSGLDQ